jgi:hypothetical protein
MAMRFEAGTSIRLRSWRSCWIPLRNCLFLTCSFARLRAWRKVSSLLSIAGLPENLDRVSVPSELPVTSRQIQAALGGAVTHPRRGQELLQGLAHPTLGKQRPTLLEVGFAFPSLFRLRRLFLGPRRRRDRGAEEFRLFLVDGSQSLLEKGTEGGDALPGRGFESVEELSIELPSFIEEALPQIELGLLNLGLYPGGKLDRRLSGVT